MKISFSHYEGALRPGCFFTHGSLSRCEGTRKILNLCYLTMKFLCPFHLSLVWDALEQTGPGQKARKITQRSRNIFTLLTTVVPIFILRSCAQPRFGASSPVETPTGGRQGTACMRSAGARQEETRGTNR